MGRYRCSTHHIDYNNSCPECRVEQEETDRQNIIEALSDLADNSSSLDIDDLRSELAKLAHKQANPGEYTCPECKFVTLKFEATRCPKCHTNIPLENWSSIRAARKAAAEAVAQKEALRKEALAEEERRVRRQREAEEKARAAAQKKADDNFKLFAILVTFGFFLLLVLVAILVAIKDAIAYVQSLF